MGVRGLRPDTIGGLFTALARRVDQLDRRLTAFIESFVGAGEHTHDFEISVEQEGVFVGQAGILNFIAGPGGNVGVTDQGDVANIVIGANIPPPDDRSDFPFILIAAWNTSEALRDIADYVCDGIDDQIEIQAAIDESSLDNFKPIFFTNGIFNLDLVETFNFGGGMLMSGLQQSSGTNFLHLKTYITIRVSEDFDTGLFGDDPAVFISAPNPFSIYTGPSICYLNFIHHFPQDIDDQLLYNPPVLKNLITVDDVKLHDVFFGIGTGQEFSDSYIRIGDVDSLNPSMFENVHIEISEANVIPPLIPAMHVVSGFNNMYDKFLIRYASDNTTVSNAPIVLIGGTNSFSHLKGCIFTNFRIIGGDQRDSASAWSVVQIEDGDDEVPTYNLFSNFVYEGTLDFAVAGWDEPDFVIEDLSVGAGGINKVDCGSVLGIFTDTEMVNISNICGATT